MACDGLPVRLLDAAPRGLSLLIILRGGGRAGLFVISVLMIALAFSLCSKRERLRASAGS